MALAWPAPLHSRPKTLQRIFALGISGKRDGSLWNWPAARFTSRRATSLARGMGAIIKRMSSELKADFNQRNQVLIFKWIGILKEKKKDGLTRILGETTPRLFIYLLHTFFSHNNLESAGVEKRLFRGRGKVLICGHPTGLFCGKFRANQTENVFHGALSSPPFNSCN